MDDTLMIEYRSVFRATLLSGLVTCAVVAAAAPSASIQYNITDLGDGAGVAINAGGQVTGYTNAQHAFLWTPATPHGLSGTLIDLGTLSGGLSYGYGINNSGQVTGFSEWVAFLWSPTSPNGTSGSMVPLGSPEDRFV